MASIINASVASSGIVSTADASGIIQVQSNGVNTNAQAWVNFNGIPTVSIRASYNVSSITYNGTGDYSANFTNAMPDTNYVVTTNASDLSNSGRQSCPKAIATGSVRVTTTDTPGLTTNYTYVAIAVFR